MKKQLLGLLLLFLSAVTVYAQDRTITGTVTAANDKLPIPAVSIRVGGQKVGTSTGANGRYSIKVNATAKVLEFSYLGYKSQAITIGSQSEINVVLQDDQNSLSEVVVTALGVKRDKRTLTYSTTQVGGNDLVAAKETNLVNAMAGKVAGVQITNASGAPGSSSKIVIRGNSSLTGDNGALFIIDGVPMDNSEAGNPDGALGNGGTSNRGIDIDPNIIETMTILRGAAATALYGSSAAKGAVIITTKQGAGKPTINISSGVTFDNAILPQFQDKYAQGTSGTYVDGNNGKLASGSWGPLIDGLTVNGQPVQKHDPRKEFFRTGFTTDNTVSVGGGSTDKSNYFVSYSYLKTKGTIPNTDFGRHSLFAKFTNKITDQVTFTGQINYINSVNDRLTEGNGLTNPLWTVYSAPISWNPFPTTNPDGTQRVYRAARNNPYWLVDNTLFTSAVNRFLPVFTVNYTPYSWLSITERAGADIYNDGTTYHEAIGVIGSESTNGKVYNREINYKQFNNDLIIEAKKNFNEDWFGSILVGNNILSNNVRSVYDKGVGLSVLGNYNIANASVVSSSILDVTKRKIGFYAQMTSEYKKMITLSLTGRYDGSSVLSTDHNFYPYGSASAGFVFTEPLHMNDNKILNFGKVRVAYSYVGNDAVAPYSLGSYYVQASAENIQFPVKGSTNSQNGFLINATYGDPNLRNEVVKEFETAVELKMFRNRLSIEATYFDKRSQDLITSTPITPSSGYNTVTINAASMYNKGIELVLNGTAIKTKEITWNIGLNFTKINNKVTAIGQGLDNIQYAGFTNPGVFAYANQPYGVIFGTRYERNADGKLLIDDNGYPIIDSKLGIIGNTTPKWNAGFTTSFSYKGFTLAAVLDMKKGGDVLNLDEHYLDFYGVTKKTQNRGETKVFDGVRASDGKPNTTPAVLDQAYYQGNESAVDETSVQDGTYIKLRQLTLSYNFLPSFIKRTPFKGLSVSLTGRNLWYYFPHYTGSDPEVSLNGSGNGSGFTNFVIPSNRSYNLAVKVTF